MLGLFAQQLGIGLLAGVAIGWLAARAFLSVRLSSPGLYPVASLATAALAFGAADTLGGSGFLAAYLAGLALGSANIPAKRTVTAFHEGMAWVAQLTMFLTLGLLVFPADLGEVAWKGTLLALVVVFVARPLATALTTLGSRLQRAREGASSAGPGCAARSRSCSPLFPVIEDVPQSETFFNIVFFAVLLSTVLQGSTIDVVARWLGVTSDEPARPPSILEVGAVRELGADVVEHVIRPGDAAAGARLRDLGLPRDALVSLIIRGKEALLPRGSTRLEAGDRLLVLVRREVAERAAGAARALAHGPGAQAGAPAAHLHRQRARLHRAAVDGGRRRPRAPARGGRQRGRRAPAHAPRRARRARDPRRRPLRRHRPDPDDGPAGAGAGAGAPPAGRATDDAEIAWWQEVIGACAL